MGNLRHQPHAGEKRAHMTDAEALIGKDQWFTGQIGKGQAGPVREGVARAQDRMRRQAGDFVPVETGVQPQIIGDRQIGATACQMICQRLEPGHKGDADIGAVPRCPRE